MRDPYVIANEQIKTNKQIKYFKSIIKVFFVNKIKRILIYHCMYTSYCHIKTRIKEEK